MFRTFKCIHASYPPVHRNILYKSKNKSRLRLWENRDLCSGSLLQEFWRLVGNILQQNFALMLYLSIISQKGEVGGANVKSRKARG